MAISNTRVERINTPAIRPTETADFSPFTATNEEVCHRVKLYQLHNQIKPKEVDKRANKMRRNLRRCLRTGVRVFYGIGQGYNQRGSGPRPPCSQHPLRKYGMAKTAVIKQQHKHSPTTTATTIRTVRFDFDGCSIALLQFGLYPLDMRKWLLKTVSIACHILSRIISIRPRLGRKTGVSLLWGPT